MLELSTISTAILGAKNLFDIVDKLYSRFGSNEDDELPSELRDELLGSEGLAREKSAEISQMIGARTYPFLLRVGSTFNLPTDFRRMEEAVLAEDVWDWTYYFNPKAMGVETQTHLRELFCDGQKTDLVREDLATTTLALSREQMPEIFGETLYIAGVILANVEYEHFYSIPERFILPTVVVKYDAGKTVGYSSPIAMNFFLRKVLDFLYATSTKRQFAGEICFDKLPSPEKRQLPSELLTGLNIKSR